MLCRTRRTRVAHGHQRLTRTVLAAAVLAALTALTGCTSTPSPTEPDATAAPEETVAATPLTVRDQLISLVVGEFATPDDISEGECFADTVMGEIGERELVKAEILVPGNIDGMVPRLPKKMVGPWVDAQFACTDYIKQATREQSFATDYQVDADTYGACYAREITEEQGMEATRAALVRDFKGDAWGQVRAAQELCLKQALKSN